ncbi:putative zinc finger protein [Orchesella cincta]|uniref:Putative zinc finger protein n=1 Tax=Orchesella cincta TaxID=48709 RepID=A0A1D2N3G5_ORCCI|nr:putative zinc finger protein [Orchesella cincta]
MKKNWPKRWQCWKENGKFAESICKVLGLPKYPYEDDFQNSFYCTSCQKRVYNMYLTVRKWERILTDISKLKSELEKDIQKSLQKGESTKDDKDTDLGEMIAAAGEEREMENGDACLKLASENETEFDHRVRSFSNREGKCQAPFVRMNKLRKKILENQIPLIGTIALATILRYLEECPNAHVHHVMKEVPVGGRVMPQQKKIKARGATMRMMEAMIVPHIIHLVMKGMEHAIAAHVSILEVKNETTTKQKSPRAVTKSKEKKSDDDDDEHRKSRESSDENVKPDVSSLSSKLFKLEQSFGFPASMDEITGEDASYAERFRCYKSKCTRAFPTKEELEIHVKRHHEGVKCPYKCEQCDKAFQWRRELDAHQLIHSGGVAVCCHLCGRGFRTQRLFGLHLKTKHASERKYKCTLCDKSFISQSKLKTHLTTHTREYPFKCTICSKGKLDFLCIHPHMNIFAIGYNFFHMAKHMDENPYQCSLCDKTFSSPRNLQVHQYTHTQTHPYKCTVCQAGAPTETLLQKHMLKHNQEKMNVCKICNKKFRFPSSLKKHHKVHEGDKRFHCQYCSKTFIDKYKLTRHERTHSGDRPFQCYLCLKSFSTKDYLSVHIRNHEKTSSNEITDNSSPVTDLSQSQTDETIPEHGIPEDFMSQIQNHNHEIPQNILHDDFMQSSSDVMISSFAHSFFPPTNSSIFPSISLPENLTNADALVATLEFDNLGAPLLMEDVIDDADASLTDLNTSSMIVSSYANTETPDFLNGEYCGFSFQQL